MPETPAAKPRVLCVDDDPMIASVLSRVLAGAFNVVACESAVAALDQVRRGPPFAVVVSDYRMPGTDGVTLLEWVRATSPDTVRILLTGNGELDTAVAAVNRGHIFRFLSKPCAPDELRAAVAAASERYELLAAERVLLEQTLHGSIKALVDVLAMAQPEAFGRATRARRHVAELCERLPVTDRWPIEIAAMLSQVGCAALSSASIARFHSGETLSPGDQAIVDNLSATAERLIAGIPRLESVREILRHQDTRFDRGAPDALPIGARMLKVVLDFDLLELRGLTAGDALETLRGRTGWYDPAIVKAFGEGHAASRSRASMQDMRLSQVRPGMVFAADVRAENGMLLVARGQEVNVNLVERIRHQWQGFAARYTVSMLVQTES